MPAVKILGFRGIVNSTTNFILTAMEQGQRFDDALAEMQARGIAEADASLDIDGWDAAAKTAALAKRVARRASDAGRRSSGKASRRRQRCARLRRRAAGGA
jgi:homoserine dehydrogenase